MPNQIDLIEQEKPVLEQKEIQVLKILVFLALVVIVLI